MALTIYPPYFVAGAVFSGFAMVQTLLLVARKVAHLEDYITMYHIEIMNIVIVVTGGMVTVAYACEYFIAWYLGSRYEDFGIPFTWCNNALTGGLSGR